MIKILHTIILGFIFMNGFAQLPVMNSIVGASAVCANLSAQNTYSTSASNNPNFYTWSVSMPNTGVIINNSSTAIASFSFPNVNATYTIYCSATNSFGTSVNKSLVISTFEMPNVSFSGANTFCQGSSTSISASSTLMSASSTVSYSWAPASGLNTTTGSNVIANPSAPTNYTVTAVNGACSNTAQITVTPFEMLTVNFSGANTFCQGSSTNLSASSTIQGASQTVFYSWSPGVGLNTTSGPNVNASPSVSTTYTVTSYYGACSNTSQITVGPNGFSPPTIFASASNSLVCYGDSTTLNASGANTYTWTNNVQNGVSFGVYNTNTYYVTGTDMNGCTNSASVNVSVDPLAYFYVNSTSMALPVGQTATLTINGNASTSYSLNGVSTQTTIVVTPTVTTTYTFTSVNSSGCEFTRYFTQYVGIVMGVQSIVTDSYFKVYPNPNNGVFHLKSDTKETVRIINELGEIIKVIELAPNEEFEVTDLSVGIYLIHSGRSRIKIIVTQ
ncbi:MAG: T9SS type A sorting domain-containing protein [Burkholderiales bacterium]|nr:T9SS type A sorting domain-containing protein [Bacteroidia bacterium]